VSIAEPISGEASGPSVRLLTARPRQIIEDFGATGCWTMDPLGAAWPEAEKRHIADLLFSREKGVGLSGWRFNIGGGSINVPEDIAAAAHPWRAVECFKDGPDAPWDWSRHRGQQWFLRAARERGVEHLVAFANTPPVWLTRNGRGVCDPSVGSTNLQAGADAEFAAFLTSVLRHFAGEGLSFHAVSPINEPCWEWEGGQEGCRYANDDMARVLLATRRALDDAGLGAVHLDACDSGDIRLLLDDDLFLTYLAARGAEGAMPHAAIGIEKAFPGRCRRIAEALLGDPALCATLGGAISGHSYWSVDGDADLVTLRRLLRATLDRYAPGAVYRMTEFCRMEPGRDLGMNAALYAARVIHHDLVDAEASSWNWWLAVSPHDYGDGLIYTDWDAAGGPVNVLPSKTLWTLGNWSRFLRPGTRRVEVAAEGLPDGLLVSGFVTHDSAQAVAVFVNPTEREAVLRLSSDRAFGDPAAWITSGERDLELSATAFDNGEVRVPERSIITVVAPFTIDGPRLGV
jgi:hypothetical protein